MLPASVGDCLWIEYGRDSKPHRILIDCGTPPTYRQSLRAKIESLGPKPFFELFVITHVDTDHIGGVLKLFDDPPEGLRFGQVWFNAWRHIEPETLDLMGPLDGEILTRQLTAAGFKWNTSFRFKGHPAVIPPTGRLRSYRMPGGMKLTLLSPGVEQLIKLRDNWEQVCKDAGVIPNVPSRRLREIASKKGVDFLGGDPVRDLAETETDLDPTPANGSTIALLAEYEDDGVMKRCILAGDAHADVLGPAIRRLADQRREDRLVVDAFKLPHHGSEHNVTKEILEQVDCRRYLFSSNGTVFKNPHPHAVAVARAIHYGGPNATLFFNYRTKVNDQWDNFRLMKRYRYTVDYGDEEGTSTVRL